MAGRHWPRHFLWRFHCDCLRRHAYITCGEAVMSDVLMHCMVYVDFGSGSWVLGSYEVSHFCKGLSIVLLHRGEYLLLNIIKARAASSIVFFPFPEQAFIPHWTILNQCRSCFHPVFVFGPGRNFPNFATTPAAGCMSDFR